MSEFHYLGLTEKTTHTLVGVKIPVLKTTVAGLFFLALLAVEAAAQPVITEQPKNCTRCEGLFSSFSVTATGATSYQWQEDKGKGAGFTDLSGALAASAGYTASVDISMNGYKYRVIVKDAAGKSVTSSVAVLTVLAAPVITAYPKDVTLCEGLSAQFKVEVFQSSGVQYTYQWNYQAPGKSDFAALANQVNPTLQLDKVTVSMNGKYWAEVANGNCLDDPTKRPKATLTVNAAPSITTTNPPPVCAPLTIDLTACVTPNPALTFSYFTDAAGKNNLLTPKAVANGGTYYINGKGSNGCDSGLRAVLVIINSLPTVTSVDLQPVCSGGDTGILLTDPKNSNTRYKWTVSSNTTITGATAQTDPVAGPILQTLTNTGTTTQTITYTVTPVAPPCPDGTSVGFPVQVSTTSQVPDVVSAPQPVCSGVAFSVALSSRTKIPNTQYRWDFIPTDKVTGGASQTLPGGGPLTGTLTLVGGTQQTARYLISPFANNCYGKRQLMNVNVRPVPQVKATPSAVSVCSGIAQDVILEDPSGAADTQFTWAITAPSTLTGWSNQSNPSSSPMKVQINSSSTQTETAIYKVTPVLSVACNGKPLDVQVSVSPPPAAFTKQPQSKAVCPNEKLELSVEMAGGGNLTYQWKKDGVDIAGANTSTYAVNAVKDTDAGKYTVAVTSGCASLSNEAVITVDKEAYFAGQTAQVFSVGIAPATSITIDFTGYADFRYDGEKDASINRTWEFGDQSGTSPLPSPRHYYYEVGTFPATLHAERTADCKKDFNLSVTVTGPHPEIETGDVAGVSTVVFPNPVKEILYFKSPLPMEGVSLFDYTGKKISSLVISGHEGSMNVETLTQGLYYLQMKTKGGVFHFKVMKQ